MSLWVYTLGSVLLVSAVSLAGLLWLAQSERALRRATPHLVSLAVGALLGGAVLHLLPRAVEELGAAELRVWLLLLAGFLGSFILESFLKAHHGGHLVSEPGEHEGGAGRGSERPLAGMVLLGDGVHNLLDGIVIAASYAAGTWTGLVTTLAVFLHEIPQELGDFGAMLRGGLGPRRALLLNLLSALTAVVGAVLTLWIGGSMQAVQFAILPIAAGNFLYIAASDLIPELHGERGGRASAWQLAMMLVGIGLMLGVRLLRQALG